MNRVQVIKTNLYSNLQLEFKKHIKMGNGNESSMVDKQIKQMLQQYEIIQEVPQQNLTYLQHKQSGKQYLLRQMTFNDKKQFEKTIETLKKKKLQLDGCQHIVPLTKQITKAEDQFCSTFYKIYALFEYPQRTLDDQINERNLHKRKFQEKQLWSILASCILGLSHLQKESIKHSSLRSSTILLSSQGIIKVADPFITAAIPNYDVLLNKRDTPHIYLSPEQAESLQQEVIISHQNPYKADIWTLGIIMLEAGLLQYQDQCYRDDSSRIHWETLNYNINRFGQSYSEELKNMIQFMLSRDQRTRPQWIDLEEHVMKVDEEVRGPYITHNQIDQDNKSNPRLSNVNNRITQQNHTPLNHNYRPQLTNNSPPNFPFNTTFRPQKVQAQPVFNNSNLFIPNNINNIGNVLNMGNMDNLNNVGYLTNSSYLNIPLSIIDHTRPRRSMFPIDTYVQKTKVDQNLMVVQQQSNLSEPEVSTLPTSQYRNQNNTVPIHSGLINNLPNNTHSQFKYQQNFKQGGTQFSNITPFRPNISLETGSSAKPQYKVQIFKMGSKYEGYQLNGMRHGKGKFYYQDGGMYDGQWNLNRMEGFGKLYYQSGVLAYEGQWLRDQFTGYGVLHNETPQTLKTPFNYNNLDEVDEFWTKYEGNFFEDNKHGQGKWYLSNGQYFSGEFKNDLANGFGTYYTMNGKVVSGNWYNNQLVNQKR